MKQEIENILYVMSSITEDNSVPRNIKRAIEEAIKVIKSSHDNPEVQYTSAIYLLDEALNDINMPFHTRTELMSVISELERIKEEAK